MTGFDELIGAEPTGAERARLREVHELLVDAGPPPELTPEMEFSHNRAMTLSRQRSSKRRRRIIFAAVAAALAAVIIVPGFGSHRNSTRYPTLFLRGTSLAPTARGQLAILSKGASPRLKLEVTNLPALKERYVVYLVRDGHPVAPCGSFTVSNANGERTKLLVSPYRLERSDTWIVTVQTRTGQTPGPTVMEPVT